MRALVTGGGGFLGEALVRLLLRRGDVVRSFSRGSYPELEALGADVVQGDLGDPKAVDAACAEMDVVFHVAAKAGFWGPYDEYYRANVMGTRNVIAACRHRRVQRLVFTSSPSVVACGKDLSGVDESVPYPSSYKAHYPETKAAAERIVLAANSPGLATVALRPHLLWGPGDPHIAPRLIARARAGKLKRLGKDDCVVDATYVDNAAEAHLLAADRLAAGTPLAGKAYFISNGEPMPLWDLINRILEAAGAPPVTKTASLRVARAAAWLSELVHGTLGFGEPALTRFLVEELSTDHWFDLKAARRDLGYDPKISVAEGLELLRDFYRKQSYSLHA